MNHTWRRPFFVSSGFGFNFSSGWIVIQYALKRNHFICGCTIKFFTSRYSARWWQASSNEFSSSVTSKYSWKLVYQYMGRLRRIGNRENLINYEKWLKVGYFWCNLLISSSKILPIFSLSQINLTLEREPRPLTRCLIKRVAGDVNKTVFSVNFVSKGNSVPRIILTLKISKNGNTVGWGAKEVSIILLIFYQIMHDFS